MAVDTSEIRVSVTGTLYVAPVGTAAPTTTVGAWPAGWVDLGALSENGPEMTPSTDVADIKIWQSLYAVRRIVTGRGMEWHFTLMQRNATTFLLAFGGGTITETGVSSGVWHYVPPAASEIDERAFGLEIREDALIDRYVMGRGMVTTVGTIPNTRTAASAYELTVSALSDDSGNPWEGFSNDPNWNPA